MMKAVYSAFLLLLTMAAQSQPAFPAFLQGTWKVENKDVFEHWDKLSEQTLKGFSYAMKNGRLDVLEYLEITANGQDVIYTATVNDQNQGKRIDFRLTGEADAFVFENPGHDFPKKIAYRRVNDTTLVVNVSGDPKHDFSLKMHKQLIPGTHKDASVLNPVYDSSLARKLGADEYGMRNYVFVMLLSGTNTTAADSTTGRCFRGHLDNISRLAREGKMIVAGPFETNENDFRGLFILNVPSKEDARQLMQSDPAIREGLLDARFYDWYGSAALPEYMGVSEKIWKIRP